MSIDASDALHVFLENSREREREIRIWKWTVVSVHTHFRCHDQFVIDDVIRCKSTTKQRTGRMQMARHTRTKIDVFTDTLENVSFKLLNTREREFAYLQSGSLVKIRGTDTFAHDVPVAAGLHVEFLRVHDVFQLLTNFAHFSHRFGVNEMIRTPVVRVARRSTNEDLSISDETRTRSFSIGRRHGERSDDHFRPLETSRVSYRILLLCLSDGKISTEQKALRQ